MSYVSGNASLEKIALRRHMSAQHVDVYRINSTYLCHRRYATLLNIFARITDPLFYSEKKHLYYHIVQIFFSGVWRCFLVCMTLPLTIASLFYNPLSCFCMWVGKNSLEKCNVIHHEERARRLWAARADLLAPTSLRNAIEYFFPIFFPIFFVATIRVIQKKKKICSGHVGYYFFLLKNTTRTEKT